MAGTRVIVRPFVTADARELWAMMRRNQRHLLEYWDNLSYQFPTEWNVRQRIKHPRTEPDECLCGIFDGSTAKLVGFGELTASLERPGVIALGYWLDCEATGRGYMTLAVPQLVRLAMERFAREEVMAWVHPHNYRSLRVLRRAGFEEHGPDAARRDLVRFSYRPPPPSPWVA